MWVDRLDPLWEHCVRVVVIFRFLARHIGQHNPIVDLRVFLLSLLQLAMHISIKLTLVSYIEHINIVVSYQIYKYLS